MHNGPVELRQLRYAVAVAEDLHFGHAAERLRVAQPSLSRQIRELEESLGVRIFDRTSRNVALTAAGEAFIEVATRTVRMADAARETAEAAAQGRIGRAVLGFVASAAGEILPPLIAKQRTQRPDVRLVLREMGTAQQVEALRGGEIDIGLTRDLVQEEDLVIEPLFHEPVLAVVPAHHPLRHKRVVDLRELAGSDFVSLPRMSAPRIWNLISAVSHETGGDMNISQEARQFATVLALVTADMGIALVPASVRGLRKEGVHYLRLRNREAYSEVQVARRALENSPSVRDFHQLIFDTLRAEELNGNIA